MPLVKVRKSNQVTIPKKIVEELGIKEGDYVELGRKGNKLYIAKKDLASIFQKKAKQMETSKLSKEWRKDDG
jgi:AbrB family looped-hinge helix DNA binding protein